jgi:hypothetical protein
VLVACVALRTNLTVRELAAVFAISKSQAHRIVANVTARLAALLDESGDLRSTVVVDRRWHCSSHARSSVRCEIQELPLVV